MSVRIHATPVFASPRIQENIPGNGRVFIQSWRRDPSKLSRKFPSFSQNDLEKFLSTGYPNTYFSWFSRYAQLTLVLSAGRQKLSGIFLRCLSRKLGSQHQLRIKPYRHLANSLCIGFVLGGIALKRGSDHLSLHCDAKCLLQGPETSKVPKVVRRGCKRSFGPRAPKSSCTGAKESCTSAKQGWGGAKDSWETFAPWDQKTFCTLS